jgi:hypothetical protein
VLGTAATDITDMAFDTEATRIVGATPVPDTDEPTSVKC